MTDLELLNACLLTDESRARLGSIAAGAFDGMRLTIQHGGKLTPKQQAWLYDCAERLGIKDAPSANLVSSGTVNPTAAERASLAEFHLQLGPKVTAPPNRMKR